MCGIIAYIGKRDSVPILIKGLQRLEYRGYDSAGLAVHQDGDIKISKKKGKVARLEELVQEQPISGTVGIAHTRWATHGEPNDLNAHPHVSEDGSIALVHNGIIENYTSLKMMLIERGYHFISETDSEVLCHLIQETLKESESFILAVQKALSYVVGAYGLAIISREYPDQIIVARKGSPLVVGIGNQELFIASDVAPLVEYTKDVIYLKDEELAVLYQDGSYNVMNLDQEIQNPTVQKIDIDLESIEKGGFDHFMLKEIFEQPKAVADSMRGRLRVSENEVILGGIRDVESRIVDAQRIIFVACGTSWHAALTAEYFIEEIARIPVEVEYASEFRYRNPIINKNDVVIAISQSGETADTLAAINLAKEKGALALGVCNVVGSSIARATDAGIYTHAGHEIGVASTKAFTTQLTVLLLLALRLGKLNKKLSDQRFQDLLGQLETIPSHIEKVLEQKDLIFELAANCVNAQDIFYLGRGYGFPTALEGALKLKEISYIHAEGYPAAEMKHGPIALIEQDLPVFFIANQGSSLEKVISNMEEIKARGGRLIAIVTEGDNRVSHLTNDLIFIPKVDEILAPFLAVIPLQLFSYHIAVLRGCDVDKPRNLAKSVTVE